MSLKFSGELFVMTMKKDAKLKEEFICHFKIEEIFTRTLESLKIGTLMGSFYPK